MIAAGLALGALGGASRAAENGAVRNRWHFAFDVEPAFRVSVLFVREGGADATTLFVSKGNVRLILSSRQAAGGRETLERIERPGGGSWLERRLFLSRHETAPACRGVDPPDACVVFRSPRGEEAAALSAFAGEKAAATRERLRRLVEPAIEESVLAVAPLFPRFADFRFYRDDFLGLLWPEAFRAEGRVETGRAEPGCDHDAAFGAPCDARERKTEAFRFRKR